MNRNLPSLAIFFIFPLPFFAQSAPPGSPTPTAPAAHGQKLHITGIPNAGKITDVLFRGAQPKEMGLSELKILGITILVDLRTEDREKIEWERQRAESLGMRFVHIPVDGWSPPTDEQVVQFLSLLHDNPGQKSSCTAISVTIAPAFSSPPFAWFLKNGLRNKPYEKCISSASTACGTLL
jgi:hypothetical protein